MYRISIFILFIILVFASTIKAQKNTSPFLSKHISNYSENEYGKEFNAQNWSVTQDKDGLMYFGNSNYVLTYDGMHWNSILVSNNSGYVTSLLATDDEQVYWGYNGDLGIIETNDIGKQTSRSLLDKIPELDQYFSRVWRIYQYKNKIAFFTQESIFLYDLQNDTIEVIYPEESFHLAFVSDNELYVRDRSYGLRKFDGEKFHNISGGDIFHNEGIFGIIPISNNKQLIITQLIGLYIYNPSNSEKPISKLESPDIERLNQQQIIGSTKLDDGNIALNTASNGVIIINEKGIIVYKINMASGITDNDVKQVFQDNYKNLWLATNNGISLVNYSSPISLFLNNEKSGLYGSVNALAMVGQQLYVGTTTGLFTFSYDDNQVFEQVEGLSKNITSLCVIEQCLIIGTTDAAYLLNNKTIRNLASIDVSSLLYSKSNTRLYIIGNNGIIVLQKKHDWLNIYEDKNLAINAIGSLLTTDSNNTDYLWIGTINKGLWHLIAPRNLSGTISKEAYYVEDNLPLGWVKPFLYNNLIYAGTSEGLYQLEDIKNEISDSLNNSKFKPYFIPAQLLSLDSGVVSFLQNAEVNNYTVYNGIVGNNNNNKPFDHTPFLSLNIGKINTLLAENKNTIWIGANGGIAQLNFNIYKNYLQKPDIKIRNLKLRNDSIMFYKASNKSTYKLDYEHNSFSIKYSSLCNENGKHPLFSYKMESYDNEWSPWSKEPATDFKKLKEGKYTFKLKCKNIYNIESDITEITIQIASPWYRTIWAYIAYLIIVIAIFIAIIRAYTYRLMQKNIQLEAIIVDRTKEIVKQKDEIELQRDLIKEVHEEIKSSIEYAKRIQTAVLPTQEFSNPIIKDYFVLFKPKDVVSGDFYWAKQSEDNLVIAVADCTGHGVPGAFMSMLGISLLNEIVGKNHITNAGLILDTLRDGVIRSLKQKEESNDSMKVMDGMDISLVSINLKSGELQWAGAHNPLFIISNIEPIISRDANIRIHQNESSDYKLYDIKADKMPIAISDKMTPFVNHNIQLKSGDTIFMFTDGYIDQFGGPKGKKFMIKAFRNMLLANGKLQMNMQMQNYEKQLEQWVSHIDADSQLSFSQVDDICLMGIKF